MWGIALISNSVTIGCDVDEAFAYLSDHRNELDWNPAIETIEKITDGPVGGTRIHADFEAIPHGWFRLIFPMFLARLRREERANMTYLRQALERRVSH